MKLANEIKGLCGVSHNSQHPLTACGVWKQISGLIKLLVCASAVFNLNVFNNKQTNTNY